MTLIYRVYVGKFQTRREKLGLTRKELAPLIGYAAGTIRNWEQGKHLDSPAFKLSYDKLLTMSNNSEKIS